MFNDINYERKRTRDLLLEYDLPLAPRAANLTTVYPWASNLSTIDLENKLFHFAEKSGYTGTKTDFLNNFGSYLQAAEVVYDNFENFPEEGNSNKLYFDLENKILYYWDSEYIPINAMLIANTIIQGGEA